ncbi:MAG: hypothetical protein LUG89_01215 [Methanosphaera sp.]|nr:hypothetical protein [Methanosphaera sp.]
MYFIQYSYYYNFYYIITDPDGNIYVIIGNVDGNSFCFDTIGTWSVKIYYGVIEASNDMIASYQVIVEKADTTITTTDIIDKYNNTIIFTATVIDEKGKLVNTGKVNFKT